MTKSRIVLIALAVACIAMLGAGTAAYFTVQDTAYNVITTATLDMTLREKTAAGSDTSLPLNQWQDFEDLSGLMPSQTVSKVVYVDNTGMADFYTRVHVDMMVVGAGSKELDTGVLTLDLNTQDWTKQGDWYYYNRPVAPGEQTTPLFTTVHFAPSMNNDYQNATTTINVFAQAVQSRNNAETALTAAGWPIESAEE